MDMDEAAQAGRSEQPLVVEVNDLRKVYASSGRAVTALDEVTFGVPAGFFYAIMGASGSGKSTLLHLIGGLTPPTAGTVLVEGANLGAMSDRRRTIFRRRRLGIIFQEYNLLPTLTAAENVALPMLVDGGPPGRWRGRVDELLATVHLEERADHRPDALSGGEQQRVAIARALLNDPVIILADEPTGNLDSKSAQEVIAVFKELHRNGNTLVMVTHNEDIAGHSERSVAVRDGLIASDSGGAGPE